MKKIVLASLMSTFALSVNAEDDVVTGDSSFNGGYLGLGLGGCSLRNKVEIEAESVNLNGKSIFGVLALGGGKAFCEKWYLGGEVSLDFGKSKTFKEGEGTLKNRGVTPELALRLGNVVNTWLVYFKPSLCFSKTTLINGDNSKYATSKPGFAIALGVEHPFCKKFTARVEAGYGIKSSKEFTPVDDVNTKFKVRSGRGFILRTLVTYNFGHLIRS
ncbi:MAG: outer membrane beta-barrel protein [Holosporaceae bacterium]|jgi:hypothetical protein|nr:outer membrane beta-barrel protein [Holosporaceae bacterium]